MTEKPAIAEPSYSVFGCGGSGMGCGFMNWDGAYVLYVSLVWCRAAQVSKDIQRSKEAGLRKGGTNGGDTRGIDAFDDAHNVYDREVLREHQRLLGERYQRECRIGGIWQV